MGVGYTYVIVRLKIPRKNGRGKDLWGANDQIT